MKTSRLILLLWVVMLVASGCSRAPASPKTGAASLDHRFVVWLGANAPPAPELGKLAGIGVDEVVIDAGEVDMGGGVPVLRLASIPDLPKSLPFGVLLRIKRTPASQVEKLAAPVWSALEDAWKEVGGAREILVDLGATPEGTEQFLRRLAAVSGARVLPVLTTAQLAEGRARSVVSSAGGCVVLLAGNLAAIRAGAKASGLAFEDQLAPLVGLGIRPRAAVVLAPRTSPQLQGWGEDIEPLTRPSAATLSTPRDFSWAFTVRHALTWSERFWKSGDRLDVTWMDAMQLNQILHEVTAMRLPALEGWDIVGLPPSGRALGMGLDAFSAYFSGEGPAPAVRVQAERSGRRVRVTLENPTPFCSAVSSFGTWVEVAVARGILSATKRGTFDRVLLGSRKAGKWRSLSSGEADAVRFFDSYIAPGEEARSAWVRLPSSRARFTVRWRVLLSTGEAQSGTFNR